MKLGNLDRYIVIESYTESTDSYGEKVKTWSTYHSCFAGMLPKSGVENITADQLTGRLNVDWEIHYKSGVNEKMRILYSGSYYQITAVLEQGREKRLTLQTYRL